MAAKTQTLIAGDQAALDGGAGPPTRTWARTHGTYIAGRAYLDEADATAAEMEAKWGAGRLRLLVGPELREKFDRQRYLLNQAVWHGELEGVRQQAMRMVRAYAALDAEAERRGASRLSPVVWEVPLANGRVAAILATGADARAIETEGRAVDVYTLEEIGRLLDGYPGLAKIKAAFPGATVTAVRRTVTDPLDGVHDTSAGLDEPLDDPLPF